jgi:hypothetical protein
MNPTTHRENNPNRRRRLTNRRYSRLAICFGLTRIAILLATAPLLSAADRSTLRRCQTTPKTTACRIIFRTVMGMALSAQAKPTGLVQSYRSLVRQTVSK